MKRKMENSVFKPTPSRFESKGDATTKAAREMLDKEAEARNAKIAKLRAARLEREAAEPAPAPVKETKARKKQG